VLVMVGIAMVAILGMVVLTVDLGSLIVKRRSMVNSMDAAALAAAQTFARNQATAGSDESPAQTQADMLAMQNVANAVHDTQLYWWTVTPGLSGQPCAPSTCGSVTVRYQGNAPLFFAPILGFGNTAAVHSAATAVWGPAGGGIPEPIMLRFDWMSTQCAAPVPNEDPPTDCGFWLNDHDDNGNALWSWINLNPGTGWNVSATHNCPSVGASKRSDWIRGVDIPDLPVNKLPAPTFVCTVSGHASSNVSELQDQIGKYRVFPVNDGEGTFAPPGQVDKGGNHCAPNTSCTPDKYDIVGFTILRIDDVLKGNDSAAIGSPGISGACSPTHSFTGPGSVWDLNTQACSTEGLHYPSDASRPYPRISKRATTYDGGVTGACGTDYCYDAGSRVITWLRPTPVNRATVSWGYETPSVQGKCGVHSSDPNAICIVASWQGYLVGGINPGGGGDFGLRAIRLAS
jgi:hypothetical protein